MNKLVESKPQFDSCYTRQRCGAAALTVGQGCQVCAQKCFDWFTVWAKSMLHTVWNKKINTVFFTIAFRTSFPFLSAFSRCIATPFRRQSRRKGGSGWEDVRHLVWYGMARLVCSSRSQYKRQPCAHISFFNKISAFTRNAYVPRLPQRSCWSGKFAQSCWLAAAAAAIRHGGGRKGSGQVSSSLLGAPN